MGRPRRGRSRPTRRRKGALNRRVEVQVWYDETQAALSEEELVKDDFKRVKVCRMETVCKMRFKEGHAHRTRIRNLVQPLLYDEAPVVSEAFVANIKGALENLQEKQHVTVKLIGFTDNVPLTDRNERIYGNHLALSSVPIASRWSWRKRSACRTR